MKNEAQTYLEEAMALFRDNPVVNWHEHVWETAPGVLNVVSMERLLDAMERTGMDLCMVSAPITTDPFCDIERCAAANNAVAEACRRYPEHFRGMCFVNPGYGEKALAEVERCVDMGFVGVKLYHQYRMNDPVQYPLIEKCIALDLPILMHAGKLNYQPESQPRLSHGEHFADVAARYPDASFLMAHITGGGDWHWQLKAIEPWKNVALDISGSVIDSPVVEECVRRIGASRVLFGTDGSLSAGVGKLLGARISVEDKKTVLAGTAYRRFLRARGGMRDA